MEHDQQAGLSTEALETHNLSHAAVLAKKLQEKYGSGQSSQGSAQQPVGPTVVPSQRSRQQQQHSVLGNPAESELFTIRKELQDIQRDVARDREIGHLQEELSSEINTLYEEIQRMRTKLDAERSLRRKIEEELEIVREDRIQQTRAVVQALDHKRTEIQRLQAERSELKQWLDIGASECRRVADEVIALRKEVEDLEKTCSTLKDDKKELTAQIQVRSDDLADAQQKLEELHHTKQLLEIRLRETQDAIRLADASRGNSTMEVERLESEVSRLNQRVRTATEAEHALASLCTAVKHLIVEVKDLDKHIVQGTISDRFDKPLVFLPPQMDSNPQSAEETVILCKSLVTSILDAVRGLEASVKRFMQDRQRERMEEQRQHQDELAAAHREKEIQLQRYNVERDALERRSQELERELLTVAAGVQEHVQSEVAQRLSQLDELIAKNRDLQAQKRILEDQNEELAKKARKMKIDWVKVDESRVRFQQLQMELNLMAEYNEKLTNENRNLRLLSQSTSADGFGSSAAPRADTTVNRHAFDAWKRTAASDDV